MGVVLTLKVPMVSRYSSGDFGLDRDYARASVRFLAWLVDFALIAGPLLAAVFWLDSLDSPARPTREDSVSIAFILYLVLWWLYSSLMHSSSWQATLGKRLARIKVTDKQGKRISGLRSLWRTLMWLMGFLPLGLGFWAILFNRKRTGFHDWFSGTLVVRANGIL